MMQSLGIQDYFKKLNFQKAIVGLSGIDSAVTFALRPGLGRENVFGVLMPSQFFEHSIADAKISGKHSSSLR